MKKADKGVVEKAVEVVGEGFSVERFVESFDVLAEASGGTVARPCPRLDSVGLTTIAIADVSYFVREGSALDEAALARGEFLVYTAGDDISMPHQAQVSVDALLADGKGRMALHATVNNVDAEGNFLYARRNPYRDIVDSPEAVLENDVYLTGSVLTVRRALYVDFPPMRTDVLRRSRCQALGKATTVADSTDSFSKSTGAVLMGQYRIRGSKNTYDRSTSRFTTEHFTSWLML